MRLRAIMNSRSATRGIRHAEG